MKNYQDYIDKDAMDLHDTFGVNEDLLEDYCKIATKIMKSKTANSAAKFMHQCMKIPETDRQALLMMFVAAGAICAPEEIL